MTMITTQAMNKTKLQKIVMMILKSVLELFSPASPEYTPVQLIQRSTTDRDASVKNTDPKRVLRSATT